MPAMILFFSLLCGFAQAAPKPNLPAEEILRKSDRARGGMAEGLSWGVRLENSDQSSAEYLVQVKGLNVIARCSAPARQKGETFLFNDRNLWIHKPGLKKPVSLSPRQRLSGQAANGDIATTNYARDYNGKVEAEEKVNGKMAYRLFLEAKDKNVTYSKIRYWVSKESFLGLKAEFLTLEGKPFKVADFQYNNKLKGQPFVSEMHIADAANAKDTTKLIYSAPKIESLPDALFNVNNLGR